MSTNGSLSPPISFMYQMELSLLGVLHSTSGIWKCHMDKLATPPLHPQKSDLVVDSTWPNRVCALKKTNWVIMICYLLL